MDFTTQIAIAASVAAVGTVGSMLWLARKAPIGHQDDDGFHLGEPLPPPGFGEPQAPLWSLPPLPANEPISLPLIVDLTHAHRAVLDQMDEEIGYPIRDMAEKTGMSQAATRRTYRELVKMGLARYVTLLADGGESSLLAGRGWVLTRNGVRMQECLRTLAAGTQEKAA